MRIAVGAEFGIAVAAVAALLSGLVSVRLAAAGASGWRIAGLLIELWAVFATWVVIFALVGRAVGEPTGASWRAELADLSNRMSALKAEDWWWIGMAIAVWAGGCLHLVRRLRRAMELHQLEGTGGEG